MVKNAIKSKIKIKQKFKNIKIKYYFHLINLGVPFL